MTHREPSLNDSSINPFDLELAEFFEEIEEEMETSDSEESDMSWFEETSTPETETPASAGIWDSSAAAAAADISDLFADTAEEREFIPEAAASDEFLSELFAAAEPEPPQNFDIPLPVSLTFYPPFEALAAAIGRPAELPPAFKEPIAFETLEALIAAPPQLPVAAVPPPTVTVIQAEFSQPAAKVLQQDEFPGMEDLLGEVERTLGSVAASQAGTTSILPAATRSQIPKTKLFEQTMRVPIRQLDNLGNLIGELVIQRNQLEEQQDRLRNFLDNLLSQVQKMSEVGVKTQELYERSLLEAALMSSHQPYRDRLPGAVPPSSRHTGSAVEQLDALEMDNFTGFHLLSQETIELIVRVRESAADIEYVVGATEEVARNLRQVTTQLQEGMTKSRMVPFSQAADRLPRAVREISLRLNKQVKLEVKGQDVLIDKMILENLSSPITHLINNAITHGIEAAELRQQRGKPASGKITIRAFTQGNQTVIAVSDDGAGIDLEKVKAKAIAKGIISSEQAKNFSRQDWQELLFYPGFTTKDSADDFAGRGVGLDVVQTSLRELRGTASIESLPGQGTTFTIRLPLTLNICKALCCWSGQSQIAFPLEMVEDTKEYLPKDLQPSQEGIPSILWQNRRLPCYSLSQLLSYNYPLHRRGIYPSRQEAERVSAIILRSGTELLALQVDRLLDEQEIVIKPIEGPVPKPPGIAGASVLADGNIMLIGDAIELMEIARGQLRTDGNFSAWKRTRISAIERETILQETVRQEPLVLIVDDSITVRELLSLSFSKAGYRVEQARDGQEAWEKLSAGLPCDLIFCDIEMPRMNGLELLSNLQNDEALASIPVALLTSRGADRHRQVAAKLGASGYLTKPYTEKGLLDAARRMLQGEVLLSGGGRTTSPG
jgi:chemosensory pili system protein ChpA (sensor histidine kinase/response regulator)